MIKVYLAYKEEKITLFVPAHAKIVDVLKEQKIYQNYLQEVQNPQFGIFGKIVPTDYVLKEGDRIELYFPLSVDPILKRKAKTSKRYKRKF